MFRYILLLFSFIILSSSAISQKIVSGQVFDKQSKKPLAFVSINIKGSYRATQSDIDGKFLLYVDQTSQVLHFNYLGYKPLDINISFDNPLMVQMEPNSINLKEATIIAGENPAHGIIGKAIENRDKNNPEKYSSFSYTSYNKFIMATENNSHADSMMKVSIDKIALTDSLKADKMSKDYLKTKRRADSLEKSMYLFLSETVSERDFLYPDFNKETIKASRISGLKNPFFTMMASQFQSFSFYNDYIKVADKNYLSPLSPGSYHKYFFNIEDTTYSGSDTVFILSFHPKQGKNFKGLKGQVHINSDGYAIQNVIAEPAEKEPLYLKIQQLYQKVGSFWFPQQLYTRINFGGSGMVVVNNKEPYAEGRTYIRNIQIGIPLKKKQFGDMEVLFDMKGKKNTEQILSQYRLDSLSLKEKNTYRIIDSVAEKIHLDRTINSIPALVTGYLPWGWLNIDLNQLLHYNKYEGLRIGGGLQTNDRISKYISLGGYYAYGFKDKAGKYGGNMNIYINRLRDFEIDFKYMQDVKESAGVEWMQNKFAPFENFRNILVSNMDKMERKEIAIKFRSIPYLLQNVFIRQEHINTTTSYEFSDKNLKQYEYAELGVNFKYTFREKFMQQGNTKVSLGSNYPAVWFQVTNGWNNFTNRDFRFLKYDFKIDKSFLIRNAGKSAMQFNAGMVEGSVPYSLNYTGKANNDKNFSLASTNNFETMFMNEFLSSQHLAFYYTHNFGKLLFKAKKFQPEFLLINNIGWGRLQHPDLHRNYAFKTMEKGYYETGIAINQIIRQKSLFYNNGYGVGIFYRYGSYASNRWQDNLALKLSFSIEL